MKKNIVTVRFIASIIELMVDPNAVSDFRLTLAKAPSIFVCRFVDATNALIAVHLEDLNCVLPNMWLFSRFSARARLIFCGSLLLCCGRI